MTTEITTTEQQETFSLQAFDHAQRVAKAEAIAPQIVVLLTLRPITHPPSPKGSLTARIPLF